METKQENVIPTDYAEVMQKSYIDYAMSVIISRALPDVRDGLKPVQRRTLYDMYELGIRYDRPYRKCARIVGDTMGKYHPHGDSSIYEALVVMAQDFKKGKTLVDGHGNFGSIEGDGAAAMRYTEARLEKLTQDVFLEDLDKECSRFLCRTLTRQRRNLWYFLSESRIPGKRCGWYRCRYRIEYSTSQLGEW